MPLTNTLTGLKKVDAPVVERRKRSDYHEFKIIPKLNGMTGENKWQSLG